MKSNLFRLFALLIVISMMASPAAAQSSQVVGPETDGAPVTVDAPAAAPAAKNVYGVSETGLYIVRLSDPSLAVYDGGLPGLDATSTSVTGARQLDTDAPASVAYLGYLEAQQASFIQSMNQALGRNVDVQFQYMNVLNGMAVAISHDEALQIAALPGVAAVYGDTVRELDTDVGPILIGGPAIWDGDTINGLDSEGEGIIIGVIDTGINSDHPSFADVAGDGHDHDNPYGAGTYVGWCVANPTFCNDKLIGAYGLNPVGGNPEDTNGHGSHTASTAGGNRHQVQVTATDLVWIQGVAPHANIIAYQVCNNGCPGSASVMAVDYALDDDVDVLNYSISGSDDPWNDPVDIAFLEANGAGIFVSASAGNDGPADGTVAKTGPWNASVAASTHGRAVMNTVDVTGPGTVPPEVVGMGAVLGENVTLPADLSDEIDYYAGNLRGCTAGGAFPAGYFTGKFALIERGDCTFAEKINNAVTAGATGALVFNNRPGAPIVMGGAPAGVPSAMLGQQDGLELVAFIDAAASDTTFTIFKAQTYLVDPSWGDIIADFSSRGFSVNEILKPDYAAPGVNILAAVSGGPDQYGYYGGTSMAAPHGAGAAALMVAIHPDWSPAQVKSAIASAADNIDIFEDNSDNGTVLPATPRQMGSGRIDLTAAAMAGLTLDETYDNYVAANPATGGVPRELNQPSLVNYACAGTCTWWRTVENVLDIAATYTATFVTDVPTLTATIDPAVFTLNPGETQLLTITANAVGLPYDEYYYGDVMLETDAEIASGGLINTALLEETFSTATFPPAGWDRFNLDAAITVTQWLTSATDHTGDGGYSAWHTWSDFWSPADNDWLVSPPVSINAAATAADVTFWERGVDSAYYEGHFVYACDTTNDCSTPPTNYVLVEETGALAGDGVWYENSVDLSAYAGSTIRVAFVYTGYYADSWRVDDIAVNEYLEMLPVSAQHLTMVVMPSSAALPDLVDVYTNWRSGMTDIIDLASAEEITDLSIYVDGLIPGWVNEKEIIQDPTNTNPYDNAEGTMVQLVDVPAGATLLLAEVLESEAPDVDLFVGTGSTPSAATEVCVSAGGSWTEVCAVDNPAAGTWWVLVQNWAGSASQPDLVKVVTGAFGAFGDAGNMMVTGPGAVPAGQPFDMTLYWDELMLMDGDYWFGSFTLGTDAGNPDNIGTVHVRLAYEAVVEVVKMAPAMAGVGDTIQYTIVITDLFASLSGMAWLTDTLPAGLDIVTDSITTTYGTAWYDDMDNAVYWTAGTPLAGTVPAPINYAAGSTNAALTLSSAAGNQVAAPAYAPEDVLWDQPLSATVLNTYANQEFGDFATYTCFGADDFVAANGWVIESIFTPGNGWNGFASLLNASALHWAIYADNGGLPAGYPGDGVSTPVWSLNLAPTDAQVTLSTGSGGFLSNTLLTLATPINLPAGTYWLFFYPTLNFSGGGQFGNQASDTTNGNIGKWINPGGGFGSGTTWINWGGNADGKQDIAFTIEGYEVAAPSSATITFDVVVNDYGLYENMAELWYDGDMFYAQADTLVAAEATFVYHDLEDVVAMGEDVYLAGEMNGWDTTADMMTPNGDYSVFTATMYLLPDDYEYKYVVGDSWDNGAGDLLNSSNRMVTVANDLMVHDYRNVVIGWSQMSPVAIDINLGDQAGPVTAEVYIQGVTAETPAGRGRSYAAQLGYGMAADMSDFVWIPLEYAGEAGNNDLLTAVFTPTATGVYTYVVRFDGNWADGNPNIGWTYAAEEGVLTVTMPYMNIYLPVILKD